MTLVAIGIYLQRNWIFLRNVFSSNGYPTHLFFNCVNRFLNGKFSNDLDKKVKEDTVETLFFIPYVGLPSVIFGRKIRDLFQKYYCIDVRVVYTSFKVRNYFSLKCRTPLPLMANVVYQFQCLRDANQTYIGKTKRHLVTRVREHGQSSSAIYEHLGSCDSCKSKFSCESFKILDHGKNNLDISVKEAIHIKYNKPSLNTQLYTNGSSFILNIF